MAAFLAKRGFYNVSCAMFRSGYNWLPLNFKG